MEHLSVSGLGGVWAEENTRESIFAAMQRKETFATSGPRIRVRLFGGWNFSPDVLNRKDWVKTGYANGVPMGGDLPPPKGNAPTFIVWAVKDPDEANLDRIQIVKGWTKSGQIFEKIYDVAWSGNRVLTRAPIQNVLYGGNDMTLPPVGNTVDVKNASYTNTIGGVELKTVWTDPDFDPSLHAFYYARVLQIPTPRWTTYDAKSVRRSAAERRAGDHSGPRLDFADLVHASGGHACQGAAWPDRGRSQAKRRGGARRRAAARPDRRQDFQGPQHSDRSAF